MKCSFCANAAMVEVITKGIAVRYCNTCWPVAATKQEDEAVVKYEYDKRISQNG